MKLNVHKMTQGPVLAKGTVQVTDTVDCGRTSINGSTMAGCNYNIPDSPGTISVGGTYKDGGTVGIQYSQPLGGSGSCC